MQCFDWRKRVVASYDDHSLELVVADRGQGILDQVSNHSTTASELLVLLQLSYIGRIDLSPASLGVVDGPLVIEFGLPGFTCIYSIFCIANASTTSDVRVRVRVVCTPVASWLRTW